MRTRIDYSSCKSSTADSTNSTFTIHECNAKRWNKKVNGAFDQRIFSQQINRKQFCAPDSSLKKKTSAGASIASYQHSLSKYRNHPYSSLSHPKKNRPPFFVSVSHIILIILFAAPLSVLVDAFSPSTKNCNLTIQKMTKMRRTLSSLLGNNSRPIIHLSTSCISTLNFPSQSNCFSRHIHCHSSSLTSTTTTSLFSVSPSKTFTNRKTNEITHNLHHSDLSLSHQHTKKIIKNDEIVEEEKNNNEMKPQKYCEKVFSLDLPEGKCVGLRLIPVSPDDPNSTFPSQIQSNSQHWLRQYLHPKEIDYALAEMSSEAARNTFFIGRLAMRSAMNELKGFDKTNQKPLIKDNEINLPDISDFDESILKDQHGRPKIPGNFIGSISHKQLTGVSLVSQDVHKYNNNSPKKGIGIDIEQTFSNGRSIAKKVLTKNELKDLGKIKGVTEDEEVLLRFSLKECVYKAMHPLICQFVGFQEAETKPNQDGTATVMLNLKNGAHEKFASVNAHWRRIDEEYFLTSASVTLKDDAIE